MAINNFQMGILKKDAQGNVLQNTYSDLEFRGEYTGTNLIYKGLARAGSAEGSTVWQIALLAYDGSDNLVSVKWPQDSAGHASTEYEFSWTARATYTFS